MRQETYEKELQFHIPTKCQHALRDHLQFVLRCKQYMRCVRNNTRKIIVNEFSKYLQCNLYHDTYMHQL